MSSKIREALEKCDALLKRITKSAWFIEARMGLTKETMDVGNAITTALATEPLRNCDVGTAEEQAQRFYKFCMVNSSAIKGVCNSTCPCVDSGDKCHCLTKWAQMPYEKESEGMSAEISRKAVSDAMNTLMLQTVSALRK